MHSVHTLLDVHLIHHVLKTGKHQRAVINEVLRRSVLQGGRASRKVWTSSMAASSKVVRITMRLASHLVSILLLVVRHDFISTSILLLVVHFLVDVLAAPMIDVGAAQEAIRSATRPNFPPSSCSRFITSMPL